MKKKETTTLNKVLISMHASVVWMLKLTLSKVKMGRRRYSMLRSKVAELGNLMEKKNYRNCKQSWGERCSERGLPSQHIYMPNIQLHLIKKRFQNRFLKQLNFNLPPILSYILIKYLNCPGFTDVVVSLNKQVEIMNLSQ